MVEQRYFVGLDLGPVGQPTGLAVLHRRRRHPSDPPDRRRPAYTLGHLHRFPPGTPYPEIIAAVRDLLRTPPLVEPYLLADYTGVGRAVLRLLIDGLKDQVTCRFSPVVITAGHQVTLDAGYGIPRRELAGTLQVLLQTRRLLIPNSLPEATRLVAELQQFQVRVSAVGSDAPEPWRDGPQDDLVLATAIAAWSGERALPPG